MNIWQQKTSVVSKLRVEGEKLDPVAARLHFERLFADANLIPGGLPPKAIVCIKNLRDPAPRTLRLNGFDLRGSEAWRNSVAREIENLFRRGFRPIREIVPVQAESVVFADTSELLACLASDWCKGLMAENWWWRGLFPNSQKAQTIARIWIESAEFAPTALQLLAKQETALDFAVKLQPDEVNDLLRRIITVFGLNKLQKVLFESLYKTEKEDLVKPSETLIEKQILPIQNVVFSEIQKLAPWFRLVPETRQISLNFDRQNLLGIGLMLVRAPQIARSTEFARQLITFKTEFENYQKTATKRPHQISTQTKKAVQKTSGKDIAAPLLKKEKTSGILIEAERDAGKFVSEIQRVAEKTAEESNELFDRKSGKEKKSEQESNKSAAKFRRKEKQIALQIDSAKISEAAVELPELIVETRYGGVFYLLNLGLYLKLYRDFTEAGEAEIDLNIWDFVALLGLAFLGEKFKDDAIWQLLKQLAGYETDEDFGKDFAAPDEWRIPAEWLETFQTNEKWLWSTDGKRLIVRHPAGFKVLDVRLSKDVKSHLKNELKIYKPYFDEITEVEFEDCSESFLQTLTEYVEKRLQQALNLQTVEQITEILFERKATAAVTPTHLDITFRLADLPFAVRLSGLDRDAGWIPAAGKFVKFHFV